MGALRRAPEAQARAVLAAFGRSWARLSLPRVRDSLTNLRIAFPDWPEARRREVLEHSFENVALSLLEFARLGEPVGDRVRIVGREHFDTARAASPNGAVIVLTAHFGNWELLAAAMTEAGYPVSVVQRPRDDAVLDDLVAERREAGGTDMLPRGSAARAALRALRDGRILAMPYDQNCSRDEGVFVPFFGRLACTRTAPARLVLRSGIPVLPVFLHREPDRVHHVVYARPPLDLIGPGNASDDATRDVRENAARMTRAIEDEIRRAPENWLWAHRRYRTQPAGEPRPYPRSGRS